MSPGTIEISPLTGIAEVQPGADLVDMLSGGLAALGRALRSDDVLIVTSKVVSKSEGRFMRLGEVEPGAEALRLAALTRKDPKLVELVLAESVAVVRAAPQVLITRHRLGFVMANAGIDQSNIGPGTEDRVLLLPRDPDATAAALRAGIADRLGATPAIVISDSFGRPWRHGVVNVAIGASGLPSMIDRRGDTDRDGRVLEVTQIALADAVASAAGLVCGEGAEGVPAALVTGLRWAAPGAPAAALVRPIEHDLFR